MTIDFNAETHAYAVDGRTLPSVTQILGRVFARPQHATEWHLQRGSANHACYAMLAAGTLGEYDPRCQPWVDGWRAWARDCMPTQMEAEVRVASVAMGFAGTADLFCVLPRYGLTVVDFKNAAGPLDIYQIAAYATAHGAFAMRGASVQIDGTGVYKITVFRASEWQRACNEWRSIMAVYHIMERVGL